MAVKIEENHPLDNLNTFGVPVTSRYFTRIEQADELRHILAGDIARNNPLLILGGGSNILFTKNYPGLIIFNRIKGIDIIEESEVDVLIGAGGGEVWQDMVTFALARNLGGIENLSLIPGSVGAAPIQNIGAYGVELKEVMESLEAIDLKSGNTRKFTNAECNFGYRDSIFKNELKDKFLITRVIFRLSKSPVINTAYGAIKAHLQRKGTNTPTIRDVSEAVSEIRRSKLPDPAQLGNAGSFFKNPLVDKIDFEGLKLTFPNIQGYIVGDNVKIPAAWLIEQCGWKGKRIGEVGVHDKQPLVLVNYGGGTGKQILDLAGKIQESVVNKFGIDLEPEPRIL
jgi:UDP-N-acetylmuramate dehydrogenase